MAPSFHLVGRLLLVALGYYVGARLGFALKFPHETPSVMWPPNAVLTTTLLLTMPRRWPMYLLAALPAHLAVELPVLKPVSLVFGLFLTNCSEAMLAAGLLRRVSDAPARLDTLRRMALFIAVAAIVAPFLSSFPDAALVSALRGEPYWNVWSTRFPSNALAELTITPTLMMLLTAPYGRLRALPFRRLVEMALLASGLLVAAVIGFGELPDGAQRGLWSPQTPFALVMPFLLWSAVRFGPFGLSVCLLVTVLFAIRAGILEVGVFSVLDRKEGVLGLQVLLTVVSIPLLCMASVIEERRRTSEALAERLAFEEMLSRLSKAFVHVPSSEADRTFETWLQRVAEHLQLDGLALLEFTATGEEFVIRSWTGTRPASSPLGFASDDFPWAVAQLRRGQTLRFGRPDDLPMIAAGERAMLRRHGVRSGIILPLEAGGRVLGGLACVSFAEAPPRQEHVESRLGLVGEVFANALARRETEDALRASEGMKSAILASLGSGVAVLDRNGTIIAVNEGWMKRAEETAPTSANRAGVGDNYLAAWRQVGASVPHARDAVAGIEAVLDRRRDAFAFAYPASSSPKSRWFQLSAVRLHTAGGGAVISQTDITDWKHAEIEAQRSREELAHFTRVSTMGALAASLAHELNQPLTGIMSNAQAARRFLGAPSPDLEEIDAILSDIVADDKRAGEVIERLRELLRKGGSQPERLDLNGLVRDVTKLVSSDALIRNVRIHLVLTPDAPAVNGDRIQLQQVVLNLLVNAMDAMVDCPRDERLVTVETVAIQAEGMGRVSVGDAGKGLESSKHDEIFEPFYTTKPHGMGMGLSISRSIVEAHAGRIWATNNTGAGATFYFTVPLAASERA
jgi:signal transduction histidine kinase/integral membrane sensor domain MASE1